MDVHSAKLVWVTPDAEQLIAKIAELVTQKRRQSQL